jgi:hypothetical protein
MSGPRVRTSAAALAAVRGVRGGARSSAALECVAMGSEAAGSEAIPPAEVVARGVDELVDEVRAEALWFLRRDYYPQTDLERLRVLDDIQKHANADAFRRAGKLKGWLSRRSSATSAGS